MARRVFALLDPAHPIGRRVAPRVGLVTRLAFWGTLALYPLFAVLSWIRLGVRKALRMGPRTVFGPTPIISIRDQVRALRADGVEAESVVFTTYYITSDFDRNLYPLVSNPVTAPWFPNLLFLWSLLRYDIFNFFYDGGLWSGMKIVPKAKWIELPLLRLAGKRVIVAAYGADVRVRSVNERWVPNICAECPAPGKHCICTDDSLMNARYNVDWANEALAMGDMFDFVPGSRLDVNHWPIDTDAVAYVGVAEHGGPVVIAHSPNHREFKGTRFLLDAVDELRRRGHDVEVDLIERVSNSEARRRYAAADVIFCQCLAGWMGFTEIEAMAAGKPVVTYLRSDDYLAHAPGFPGVSAPPERLVDELERLVGDYAVRDEMGRAGREWVERYWSYRAVSPILGQLHRDVWRHNHLIRTLRRKRLDLRWGRGRWSTTVPSRWASSTRQLPVSVDMHRLGGAIVGLRSTPTVQAMCSKALVSLDAGDRVAASGAGRAFVAATIVGGVRCGPTLAFAAFVGNRVLPDGDNLMVDLAAHVASVAHEVLGSAAGKENLLDFGCYALALYDLSLHARTEETATVQALSGRVETLAGGQSTDGDGCDVERQFLLAQVLETLSRATDSRVLSRRSVEVMAQTRGMARRLQFSVKGTW